MNRGWIMLGRRWHLSRRRRDDARRASSWAGIGPVRDGGVSPYGLGAGTRNAWRQVEHGPTTVLLDLPPTLLERACPVVGAALHIGPHLLVLTWMRLGVRGSAQRAS